MQKKRSLKSFPKPFPESASKRAIIDASSAIILFKSGLMRHLTDHYRLRMPESVYSEITVPGYPGAEAFAVGRSNGRFEVMEPDGKSSSNRQPLPAKPSLGAGEQDVIALFAMNKGDFIIMDDGKGAAVCRSQGLPYINALLLPRILRFTGAMSGRACRLKTEKIIGIGRYSRQIIAWAEKSSRRRLQCFLP